MAFSRTKVADDSTFRIVCVMPPSAGIETVRAEAGCWWLDDLSMHGVLKFPHPNDQWSMKHTWSLVIWISSFHLAHLIFRRIGRRWGRSLSLLLLLLGLLLAHSFLKLLVSRRERLQQSWNLRC